LVDFPKKFPNSIADAKVGFMSPETNPRFKNPSYEQVCTGISGHVEVVWVALHNPQEHFEELCRFFFTFHDPTLKDRQGNDRGFQYSSWIFCADDEQLEIANRVKQELQDAISNNAPGLQKAFERRIVETRIAPLKEFTVAKKEHQEYLVNNPNGYCNHRIRMKEWYQIVDAKK
jgi:peptide-methionine (S)-S-oxide reductase